MTFAARSVGMGGSGFANPLAGGSADELTFDPTNASAGWRWNSDGTVDKRVGASYIYDHNWYLPTTPGIGSGKYIHHGTVTGNALTTDTVGTAGTSQLDTAKEVRLTTTAPVALANSFTINITTASGLTPIVSSGSYSINVERSI